MYTPSGWMTVKPPLRLRCINIHRIITTTTTRITVVRMTTMTTRRYPAHPDCNHEHHHHHPNQNHHPPIPKRMIDTIHPLIWEWGIPKTMTMTMTNNESSEWYGTYRRTMSPGMDETKKSEGTVPKKQGRSNNNDLESPLAV